jgi:hypothetical protein
VFEEKVFKNIKTFQKILRITEYLKNKKENSIEFKVAAKR